MAFPLDIVEDVHFLVEEILKFCALGFFEKARRLSDECIDEYLDIFPFVAERMRLLWEQGDFDTLLDLTERSLSQQLQQLGQSKLYTGFWPSERAEPPETQVLWLYRRLAALATGKLHPEDLRQALTSRHDGLNSVTPITGKVELELEPVQVSSTGERNMRDELMGFRSLHRCC